MIVAYPANLTRKAEVVTLDNPILLKDAIWIDLLNPTKEEEMMVESLFALDIPTREELQGIEPSSRLYKEDGAIFMTATMVAKAETSEPKTDAVTLIIKDDKLITVRYIEPLAFNLFISRIPKLSPEHYLAENIIVELFEAVIDRLAEILEGVGLSLDKYSQIIFRPRLDAKEKLDYQVLLQDIGANGDLNSKVWESLVSFTRVTVFFNRVSASKMSDESREKLASVMNDINALGDHVKFFATKVNFLLDATLGMVNIEQNNIIKIFSIAAVIFLPPTLVASIYGMNFEFMPELHWHFGYPFAIVLLLISAWLPYKYFKIKKWL